MIISIISLSEQRKTMTTTPGPRLKARINRNRVRAAPSSTSEVKLSGTKRGFVDSVDDHSNNVVPPHKKTRTDNSNNVNVGDNSNNVNVGNLKPTRKSKSIMEMAYIRTIEILKDEVIKLKKSLAEKDKTIAGNAKMIAHLELRIDSLRYEILLARKVTKSMDAKNKALQKDVGLLSSKLSGKLRRS